MEEGPMVGASGFAGGLLGITAGSHLWLAVLQTSPLQQAHAPGW
jgi:hypothetical protein